MSRFPWLSGILWVVGSLSRAEAYRKYSDDLVRFATGLVGPSDGPDLVSAAMVNVLASPSWQTVQNERAYLYATVLNEARRHHRRTMRRRAAEIMTSTPREWNATPEVRPDVLEAVGRLSVRQRAVVFLTYWEDLTPADTARRLGVSPGTVYRNLARGETRLRRLLHD